MAEAWPEIDKHDLWQESCGKAGSSVIGSQTFRREEGSKTKGRGQTSGQLLTHARLIR